MTKPSKHAKPEKSPVFFGLFVTSIGFFVFFFALIAVPTDEVHFLGLYWAESALVLIASFILMTLGLTFYFIAYISVLKSRIHANQKQSKAAEDSVPAASS